MKLWLLEILACPIDHAFPLECTIFHWENEEQGEKDEIKALIDAYKKGFVLPPKTETPVKIENREEGVFVHDNLVLKPTQVQQYFEILAEKIGELKIVHDKSQWAGEQALQLIINEIQAKLQTAIGQVQSLNKEKNSQKEKVLHDLIDSVMPQLEFLNLFKYQHEIEDAVIICPKCGRWFPVFETIPQMLPDEVRNAEQDKAFSEKWSALFPEMK